MTKALSGKVYLVGAGPGDPDLLTLKAHSLIRTADVIFHDDLVSSQIVALAAPHAMVVDVGKRCGAKNITQEEINRLMLGSARRGLSVVRLKSGDPGVFGRLAEERDALEAAGVPYEIVPGVTAALAAAASLGASLTDRRTSSRIVVVTASRAHENAGDPPIDWRGLAGNDSTIAIYMPGGNYAATQQELLSGGLDGTTPVAIVSRAASPAQQMFHSTLAQLHDAPRLEAPTILLIGRTLAGSEQRAQVKGRTRFATNEAAADSAIRAANSTENFERRVRS